MQAELIREQDSTAMSEEVADTAVIYKSKEQLIYHESGNLETNDYGATEPVCILDDNRNRSLAATACCCPCGVIALQHSRRVNSRMRAGDVEGAKESSKQAVRYSNISFLTGFFAYGIFVLFLFCLFLIGIFVAIDAARGFF